MTTTTTTARTRTNRRPAPRPAELALSHADSAIAIAEGRPVNVEPAEDAPVLDPANVTIFCIDPETPAARERPDLTRKLIEPSNSKSPRSSVARWIVPDGAPQMSLGRTPIALAEGTVVTVGARRQYQRGRSNEVAREEFCAVVKAGAETMLSIDCGSQRWVFVIAGVERC